MEQHPHHHDRGLGHDPTQAKILGARNLEELANTILLDQFGFNLVNCSTAFNKFGQFRKERQQRLTSREQGALKVLIDMAREKEFQPRQASSICRAIATGHLHEENPQILQVFETFIKTGDLKAWKPMELSHLVEAAAALKFGNETFIEKFTKEITGRAVSDFNAQDIATISSSLGALQVNSPEVFKIFGRELATRDLRVDLKNKTWGESEMGVFTLQRLVSTIFGFANSNAPMDSTLLDRLASEIASRPLKHMRCCELANVCWAFTHYHHFHKPLFERIIQEADIKCARITFQQMTILLWTCSQANLSENAFRRLSDIVAKEMKLRSLKDEANDILIQAVWNLSRSAVQAKEVFAMVAEEFGERRAVNQLSNQSIAQLASSFGTIRFEHPQLFDSICISLSQRSIADLASGELVALASSLPIVRSSTSASPPSCDVVDQLHREVISRGLETLSDTELANFVSVLGYEIGLNSDELQIIMREVRRRNLQNMKPKAICLILNTYGTLGWRDTALFESVGDILVTTSLLDHFTLASIGDVACAFASLEFLNRALFDRIARATISCINRSPNQVDAASLCRIIWAMACNDHLSTSCAQELFNVVPKSMTQNEVDSILLSEIVTAFAQNWSTEEPPPLIKALKKPQGTTTKPKTFEAQIEIAKTFQDMGYVHLVEDFRTQHGLGPVIRLTSNVVIVIVPVTTIGACKFKHRLWEGLGYWVVSISHAEWLVLSNNDKDEVKLFEAKQDYLAMKLLKIA